METLVNYKRLIDEVKFLTVLVTDFAELAQIKKARRFCRFSQKNYKKKICKNLWNLREKLLFGQDQDF